MAKTGTGKYEPVVTQLRDRISGGDLAPGDWLPSEGQLMESFGVSRYSAREAIKRLASEGLIVVVDGKGSHVRARTDRARHSDTRTITITITVTENDNRAGGSGGRGAGMWRDAEFDEWTPAEEPVTYRVDAGVDLALTLGIPEHTPCLAVDRLLERPAGSGATPGTGTRRMLHRLSIPMSTATRVPAIADDPFPAPDALYAVLTDAGMDMTLTEHVRAVTPTPDDTASLAIAPGAAVLVTRRIVRDANGLPLAMEETRRSGEDTQLTYSIAPHS